MSQPEWWAGLIKAEPELWRAVTVALELTLKAGVVVPRGATVNLDDPIQVAVYVYDCRAAGLAAADVRGGMHAVRRRKFWPSSAEFVAGVQEAVGVSAAVIRDPVTYLDPAGRERLGSRSDANGRFVLTPNPSHEELALALGQPLLNGALPAPAAGPLARWADGAWARLERMRGEG